MENSTNFSLENHIKFKPIMLGINKFCKARNNNQKKLSLFWFGNLFCANPDLKDTVVLLKEKYEEEECIATVDMHLI